jgi:prepilin-type N-terminal cleavage/methylation domain-containing protein
LNGEDARMGRARGFTLIELMIVIAIIAIIAAIAIPGLLQSQRASNERNASASLKTLCTSNADFRTNDRDGNHVNDYWTRDVSGLFTAFPPGSTSASAIKLVDRSIAAADTLNFAAMAAGATNPGTDPITLYGTPSPKAGYWYFHLWWNLDAAMTGAYGTSTDNTGWTIHNNSMFAFGAFADSYSSGRQLFVINEGNTMFKRQCIATIRPGVANPPGWPLTTGVANGGVIPPYNWPSDTSLKAEYAKMD